MEEQQALILEALRDLQVYAKEHMRKKITIDDKLVRKNIQEKINLLPTQWQSYADEYKDISLTSFIFDDGIEKRYNHMHFHFAMFALFLESTDAEIKETVLENLKETDPNHTIEDVHINKVVSYIKLFMKILDP